MNKYYIINQETSAWAAEGRKTIAEMIQIDKLGKGIQLTLLPGAKAILCEERNEKGRRFWTAYFPHLNITCSVTSYQFSIFDELNPNTAQIWQELVSD